MPSTAAYLGREPRPSKYRNDDPIEARLADSMSIHPFASYTWLYLAAGGGQGHTDTLGWFNNIPADHPITCTNSLLPEPQTGLSRSTTIATVPCHTTVHRNDDIIW